MPKPNSKKKESGSANLQEDDLPSNFEKSEIENDTLILEHLPLEKMIKKVKPSIL